MTIHEFSLDDIIHRVESAKMSYGVDRSYLGEPMKLIWLEKGLIFLKHIQKDVIITLVESEWMFGWDFYPVEMAIQLGLIEVENVN